MISHESERLDFTTIPESKGIRKPAFIVLAIGLIGIFCVGGLSIKFAGYGHCWPSTTSMRMSLTTTPPCPSK